jgi:hypothetical protein
MKVIELARMNLGAKQVNILLENMDLQKKYMELHSPPK